MIGTVVAVVVALLAIHAAMKVAGATDAPLNDLVKNGTIKLEKVKTIDLPRKPEWLGW